MKPLGSRRSNKGIMLMTLCRYIRPWAPASQICKFLSLGTQFATLVTAVLENEITQTEQEIESWKMWFLLTFGKYNYPGDKYPGMSVRNFGDLVDGVECPALNTDIIPGALGLGPVRWVRIWAQSSSLFPDLQMEWDWFSAASPSLYPGLSTLMDFGSK